jgi:hypothetical protein
LNTVSRLMIDFKIWTPSFMMTPNQLLLVNAPCVGDKHKSTNSHTLLMNSKQPETVKEINVKQPEPIKENKTIPMQIPSRGTKQTASSSYKSQTPSLTQYRELSLKNSPVFSSSPNSLRDMM